MQNGTSTLSGEFDLFDLFDIGRPAPIEKQEQGNQGLIELETQSGWVHVEIENMATPRPRARVMKIGNKVSPQIYNPTEYTNWKKALAECLKFSGIKKGYYNCVELIVGIPIKKSYTKKEKIAMLDSLHEKKPDFDNFVKGVLDAISDSEIIRDDNAFGSGLIEKVWIGENEAAFILFNLKLRNSPKLNFRSLIQKSKKMVVKESFKRKLKLKGNA
ncbi:RusA family crossover junction endodeoxyribonuclease [Mongoliitalea daihaiensis]|uniref:RusA family crossover junction endodeoxyribonuclease n=1 Tax=Mongoliitalea daihaiensis TaxID=2782006 RepID=UPI001F308C48|nr:RusA family crossover junction endodeoxyribonuclease [Mongoliitalea daihaiensis]UJP64012.1 RusA family crossover junction endodeoxyribonuclease [Mongoliitalea daihaiensis]